MLHRFVAVCCIIFIVLPVIAVDSDKKEPVPILQDLGLTLTSVNDMKKPDVAKLPAGTGRSASSWNDITQNAFVVNKVKAGSKAAQAGLETDDVISLINGKRFPSLEEANEFIEKTTPSKLSLISYKNDGKFKTIIIVLNEKEEAEKTEKRQPVSDEEKKVEPSQKKKNTYNGWKMISLHTLDKSELDGIRFSAKNNSTAMNDGFLVKNVKSGCMMAEAGLYWSDIIVSFNGKKFKTIEAFETWLDVTSPDTLTLVVHRYPDYKKGTIIVQSKEKRELLKMTKIQEISKRKISTAVVKELYETYGYGAKTVVYGVKVIDKDTANETIQCISNIAQSFQGQDLESVLNGLIQCNIRYNKMEKHYHFLQWIPKSGYYGGTADIYFWGVIDIERKRVSVFVELCFWRPVKDSWFFADSIRVTDNTGFVYQSEKLEFNREVRKPFDSDSADCCETATLNFDDAQIQGLVKTVINDKGVIVRFYGKNNVYSDFEASDAPAQWSAEQLKDVYEALQVIKRNFNNP